MINISLQEKFSSKLTNYIISKIAGTHKDDEIIEEKPHRLYLIGTLAARKGDDPEDVAKSDDGRAASIRASKLKVSILSKKNELTLNSEMLLKATGNVYYKIKDDQSLEKSNDEDEEVKPKTKRDFWKRIDFSDECKLNISHNSEVKLNFSSAQEKANNDPLISKKIPENLWNGRISVNLTEYSDEEVLISFNYENFGKEQEQPDDFERTLFNCKLEIDLGNFVVEEFIDEYLYEGHKQRYFYDFRTMNCQARWLDDNRKHFITEHFAQFEQQNIRPKESIPNLNLTFSNLMVENNAILSLEGFVDELKKYNKIYKTNIPLSVVENEYQPRKKNDNRQNTWGERIQLAEHFGKLITRIENGLNLIKTDTNVKESFLKTNETFNNYYITQDVSLPNASWRLFQLAFFLSSIESVAEERDLDVADVLHVDTGGGKSEAYFALVVFTSFYERCTGKKDGVSAIVKFPLRMLSIQQLERAAGVIIHAEEVRKKHDDLFSGTPFSLGYYVGSKDGDFPDLYAKVRENLYENKKLISPAPSSKIISKCPICPSYSKGTLRLEEDTKHQRIVHKCDKCNKKFYIYQSDREVFRWRPTVIVSTVDKWASLSSQRRVRNLLGGTGSMCPDGHGFIPSGDKCEDKKDENFQCSNIGENLQNTMGPRLSIQDEMHLLKEGFGTISAHFEGLIETIVEDRTNRKLKHIAMSATLNGTKKQIKELYNKKYFVIPGRCPEGAGSTNDFFFEKKEGPKRIICGLKPNLRDNHYASLRSLLHFAEFIIDSQTNLNSDPNSFCEKYSLKSFSDAQDLLNQYLVPLTYHIKKQDAYEMSGLENAVVGDTLKDNFGGSDIHGTVLTGDSGLEELKETIDNVRDFVKNYDPNNVDGNGLSFEPIYATSVVSHGVDLDELNFMTFQGLPYSTSEYIQALSRVGRKNLGIILLWFYPNRVRDESFFRNFVRYHDSIDHEVRPVPINRFSKLGLMQTINSLFCAGIINYLSNKKGKPLYYKRDVINLTLEDQKDLVNFIESVYGKKGLDITIPDEVEDRIKEIVRGKDGGKIFFPNILSKSGNPFYRNQSGMRGIQKQLALDLNSNDERILKRMGK
ncbi:MAG: hypothetical protein GQ533_00010 [Methanosarcinaceae archaeon]|nr:hypothetical protein [Methanosarcinaceae archaeon]